MIKANFNTYNSYVTDSLHQWDKDQTLQVSGVNIFVAPEIHFTNFEMDRAIVRQGELKDGVISVKIPNSLLQSIHDIKAYIGVWDGDTFTTLESVVIPVIMKDKPEDYVLEIDDEEYYSFSRLENEIANMVTLSAFNSQVNKTENAIKAKEEALKARINNIIAHNNNSDGNSELIDLRTDVDGVIHDSAGDAVRSHVGKFGYQADLFTPVIGNNKLDESLIKENVMLSTSDGSEVHADNYMTTPFIYVKNVKVVDFYRCDNNLTPKTGWFKVFWYNSTKDFLSYNNGNMILTDAIPVVDNAVYVRFVSVVSTNNPYVMVTYNNDKSNYTPYKLTPPPLMSEEVKKVINRVKNLESKQIENKIILSENRLDNSNIIGGYYDKSGNFQAEGSSSFYTVSEMIDLKDNSGIINIYICDNNGIPVSSWYTINFYDNNKKWIEGNINQTYSDISTSVISIPYNAKYAIPSFVSKANASNYMVSFDRDLYGYDDYTEKIIPYDVETYRLRPSKWVGKKVLVIGDSISTSNYRGIGDDGKNLPLWKKWDDVLADKLGFTMVKDAISASGFIVQPTTTEPGEKSICYRVDNYPKSDKYDMIILFAGINDFLQGVTIGSDVSTDRTIDFISAVDYSVRTLIDKFPMARLVGVLPLPIGMYTKPEQNDTSAYVNVLKEIYTKYGVPYLDLSRNSGFKPHIQSFKNMFTLNGGSSDKPVPDGLHPNKKWDNEYLAPMIEDFINRFI